MSDPLPQQPPASKSFIESDPPIITPQPQDLATNSIIKVLDGLIADGRIFPWKRNDWLAKFERHNIQTTQDLLTMPDSKWDLLDCSDNIKKGLKQHVPGLKIPLPAQERQQKICPHLATSKQETSPSVCCDITEITCNACGLILVKSYSTSYDKDPNTEIGDWNWYLKYYQDQYHQTPNRHGYTVKNWEVD